MENVGGKGGPRICLRKGQEGASPKASKRTRGTEPDQQKRGTDKGEEQKKKIKARSWGGEPRAPERKSGTVQQRESTCRRHRRHKKEESRLRKKLAKKKPRRTGESHERTQGPGWTSKKMTTCNEIRLEEKKKLANTTKEKGRKKRKEPAKGLSRAPPWGRR